MVRVMGPMPTQISRRRFVVISTALTLFMMIFCHPVAMGRQTQWPSPNLAFEVYDKNVSIGEDPGMKHALFIRMRESNEEGICLDQTKYFKVNWSPDSRYIAVSKLFSTHNSDLDVYEVASIPKGDVDWMGQTTIKLKLIISLAAHDLPEGKWWTNWEFKRWELDEKQLVVTQDNDAGGKIVGSEELKLDLDRKPLKTIIYRVSPCGEKLKRGAGPSPKGIIEFTTKTIITDMEEHIFKQALFIRLKGSYEAGLCLAAAKKVHVYLSSDSRYLVVNRLYYKTNSDLDIYEIGVDAAKTTLTLRLLARFGELGFVSDEDSPPTYWKFNNIRWDLDKRKLVIEEFAYEDGVAKEPKEIEVDLGQEPKKTILYGVQSSQKGPLHINEYGADS